MSNDPAPQNKRHLSDAVREVKIAAAERQDVIVDMKEADRARLELLYNELQPVFDEVSEDDDQFDFALSSGAQPRLWIDAVAHVHMGHDRRTFRFVLDRRYGRSVLAESDDLMKMADQVTIYIAERTVERQRFMAGDDFRYATPVASQAVERPQPAPAQEAEIDATPQPAAKKDHPNGASFVTGLIWFIIGSLVTLFAMGAIFWGEISPSIAGL
ncbi:hypothetical protein AAFN47_06850 [Hoeflea sp. CAU 1731]